MQRVLWVVLILIVLSAAGVWAYLQLNRPLEVETALVQTTQLTKTVTASGKLISKNEHSIYAPVTGAVAKVHVDEYATVAESDWLVTIKNASTDEDTLVTAPAAGVVTPALATALGSGKIDEKLVVNENQLLYVVKELDFDFLANFNQTNLDQFAVDDEATIVLDAYPDQSITGRVKYIQPITQTSPTGENTIPVTIHITGPLPEPRLLDLTGDVSIVTEEKVGLTIPLDALTTDNGNDIVYVVQDNRAVKKPVTIGEIYSDQIEILTGLSLGERAITEPLDKIKDGVRVKIE